MKLRTARPTGVRLAQVATVLTLAFGASVVAQPTFAADPMNVKYVQMSRMAIWNDGSDATTLKLKVSGPVTRVIADDGHDVIHVGDDVGRFELYDDGTHGDQTAGDDVFTRANLRAINHSDIPLGVGIELRSGSGAVKTWDWPITGITVLDRDREKAITRLDSKFQYTGRVANLVVDTGVYKPTPNYSNRKRIDLRSITRRFYKRFPDRYDFVSIWLQEDIPPGFYHSTVRNNVKGIGTARFNDTKAYGSKGRLKGVNFLGETGEYALIHETLHQWSAYLDKLGLSRNGHWWSVNVRGYHYGLGFVPLGDGRFRITWTPSDIGIDHRMPFLELYLAGFAKRGEVPKVTRLVGVDPRDVQTGDVVRPTKVVKKSIARIIKRYGARQPAYAKARKKYRMGTVLVTVNRWATPAEMTMYHLTMEKFASIKSGDWNHPTTVYPSWNWATRGRSKMDTSLGAPR